MLILGAVLLMMGVVIWTQQRNLIYFPFGQVPDPLAIGLKGTTPVTFATADGLTLHGWFIAQAPPPRFTVIVFNGNAGNRGMRAALANALGGQGMAVLLFDYRGYGGNPGSPTEAGLREDARAALKHVLSRPDVDPARLVYFGESLGSAVAAGLALEHPPAGLILRSPFTSLTDVGRVHYTYLPVAWLLRDRFDTLDLISRIRVPLLVIAGDRDRVVPVSQSRRLYDAANEPKTLLIVPNADHNDPVMLAGRDMLAAIQLFLSRN
jgi:fermentation-respiration switch protein FrsA (DUF1100 family)